MDFDRIIIRVHAIKRMVERSISEEDIRRVLAAGEVIEEYPNDKPYPSQLMLGFSMGRQIHVLMARENRISTPIVITVYMPDTAKWSADFRKRKRK
jgi:hypothetical protein